MPQRYFAQQSERHHQESQDLGYDLVGVLRGFGNKKDAAPTGPSAEDRLLSKFEMFDKLRAANHITEDEYKKMRQDAIAQAATM